MQNITATKEEIWNGLERERERASFTLVESHSQHETKSYKAETNKTSLKYTEAYHH